jgi:5'-nucleotidase
VRKNNINPMIRSILLCADTEYKKMVVKDRQLTILITNDDGIYAQGLWALHRELSRQHRVLVVAPDRERSAVGHGITLNHPIRATEVSVNGGPTCWAVSGTPADCIKLALLELLDQRPDVVVSGINPGANVGINLNYSGTVAAAKEAAQYGLTAMSVSIQKGNRQQYEPAAQLVAELVPLVHAKGLPAGTFLNINFPNLAAHQKQSIRLSRQSVELYPEYFDKRRDPRNGTYYWQGCESPTDYAASDVDGAVLKANQVSITPVRCDMTDYSTLEHMKSWGFPH